MGGGVGYRVGVYVTIGDGLSVRENMDYVFNTLFYSLD